MKNKYTSLTYNNLLPLLLFCSFGFASFAQEATSPLFLGTIKEFQNRFSNIDPAGKRITALQVLPNKSISINTKNYTQEKNDWFVFGTVEGFEQATFFAKKIGNQLIGKVIFRLTKEAYDIYTNNNGEVFISPIDINKVICVDYEEYIEENLNVEGEENLKTGETMATPLLNSLPNSTRTIYLDFDGEDVSGGSWGNINASPSSFSDANIKTIWTSVAEDYTPYDINVTTDSAVFYATASNRRVMVIFTPTNTAAPGAGGVALLGSYGSDEPVWIFNNGVKGALEAASHETGHTMGLHHDGRTSPSEEYFAGQGTWGPIMGAVYTRAIVQWSKGEYTASSNKEDDLTKISTKIPYRVDDAGNTPATANGLIISGTGAVASSSNFGFIGKSTDVDVFSFTTIGGLVSFSITTKTESGSSSIPDLDIQVRLLDTAGTEIVKVDPTGVLSTAVTVSQTLAAGTYYLEIDGVGSGSPTATGYSDYGSLGQYFISGTIPGGTSTDINEAADNHTINIYPNPSTGLFTLNIPLEGNSESSIEILNSIGQPVLILNENSSGNNNKEINLSGYASGIYCVMVRAGGELWKGKVILK